MFQKALAVNGTLMRGLKLNTNLTNVGGEYGRAIPVPILVASLGYWLLCRNQSADSVISSY
ncbi:hypothetical protein [Vibrio aestuarianus]|uniref:hypothetical protein n=1 Tax=Vibrio aestuarianus TaxID=28171 RepID=UPI00237CB538|nr:hypothetical protein [Vibrio aestuarianus]MDE1264432.1 hypothetical protein [Vibrio aestuarianus]MDE1296360.1 hypothetical protein [Vibrio aestuarianus]MDE1335789.1 hypothetical protein [Vibrio aestuarianus]